MEQTRRRVQQDSSATAAASTTRYAIRNALLGTASIAAAYDRRSES